MNNIPCIKKDRGIDTLFVDDLPFFILGGECHNSAASDLTYLEDKVFRCVEDLSLNTLFVPVSWELCEPEKGRYDFSLAQGVIDLARKYQKHLVLLWFGLWKNGESDYVPSWLKTDPACPYIINAAGSKLNTISPLCEEAVNCDAACFERLMEFLRCYDGETHTVLMVQVENEIGVLHGTRDYSELGEAAFQADIPASVSEEYQIAGTWQEVFGEDAIERFMAYAFANAVETIASRGKNIYPIPLYTNAWLKQFPWTMGTYPTGGPIPENLRIWKAAAPSLSMLSPDIYVGYVPEVMQEYTGEQNPLLIPEIRKDASTAAWCLYALGHHHALGYSPFAIEEFGWAPQEVMIPPTEWLIALNIDPTAFDMTGAKPALSAVYTLVQNIYPLYLAYRGSDRLQAFVKKGEFHYGDILSFSEVDALVSHGPKRAGFPISGGIIIETEPNCFYVIGMSGKVEFVPKHADSARVEIIRKEEGSFVDGKWKKGRRLNGDERGPVQLPPMPCAYYVEVVVRQ